MRGDRMQRNLRLNHTVDHGDPPDDGRARLRRRLDAEHDARHAGGRARLPRSRPAQPGKFFALAQSPQLFKQLCMVGGLDRYYQIATCWRDEDLRADRQFEFRQLDLEMSFVEREDVLDVLERCVVAASRRSAASRRRGRSRASATRRRWRRYGTDKPDLRFGLEIQDATEVTRGSEFGVFANAPCVRYLVVPRAFSRAELERLEEIAKEWGAKGLAYIVSTRARPSPIAKFLSEGELEAFGVEPGSTALFVADDEATRRSRPRRPADASRRASSSSPTRRGGLPLGRRLPAVRARRGHGPVDVPPPPVHGADRRATRTGRGGSRLRASASTTT